MRFAVEMRAARRHRGLIAFGVVVAAGIIALTPAVGREPPACAIGTQQGAEPPGLAWPRRTGRLEISVQPVLLRPVCHPDEACEF